MKTRNFIIGALIGSATLLIPSYKLVTRWDSLRSWFYSVEDKKAPYFVALIEEGGKAIPCVIEEYSVCAEGSFNTESLNRIEMKSGRLTDTYLSPERLAEIPCRQHWNNVLEDAYTYKNHIYINYHLYGRHLARYDVVNGKIINAKHRPIMNGMIAIFSLIPIVLWLISALIIGKLLETRSKHGGFNH